jgi:hypothetical protein
MNTPRQLYNRIQKGDDVNTEVRHYYIINPTRAALEELFKFHNKSKSNNLASKRLKNGIMALLSKIAPLSSSRKRFLLNDLPKRPGVWDHDIIEALFRFKHVATPYRYLPLVYNLWAEQWPYYKHDPDFFLKIVKKYAPKDVYKSLTIKLQMQNEYDTLQRNVSKRKQIFDKDGEWEVLFWSNHVDRVTKNVLPKKRISRMDKINHYLNFKEYPKTRITIYPDSRRKRNNNSFSTSMWNKAFIALDLAIDKCPFRKKLLEEMNIAIAMNNGVVVGGFSYGYRGRSLSMNYLCSSKLVPNIGTVLMYAAEEFARKTGHLRIFLNSTSNAKMFYFLMGYDHMSNNSNCNYSEIKSNYSNSNSNSNRNNAKSSTKNNTLKRKGNLIFPSRTPQKLRKYVVN